MKKTTRPSFGQLFDLRGIILKMLQPLTLVDPVSVSNNNALFRIGGDLFGGASVEDIIDQCKTVIEDFRIKQPDQFEKYVEFYEGFAE